MKKIIQQFIFNQIVLLLIKFKMEKLKIFFS